jgi:manganese-dependent ADP-ribose/CDP-alcohol diphosphatase
MSLGSVVPDSRRRRRRRNRQRWKSETSQSDVDVEPEAREKQKAPLLFSVGMIADIQYAPIPDGTSFTGTPRYYRHSLEATKDAFRAFAEYQKPVGSDKEISNDSENDGEELDESCSDDSGGDGGDGVDLVVNLGDIVDGKCQEIEKNGGCLLAPDSSDKTDDETNALWKDVLDHPGMLSLLEIKHAMRAYSEGANTKGRKILHSYGNHCLYNLNRNELRETLGIPFRVEPSVRGFCTYSESRRRQESMPQTKNNRDSDTANGDDDEDLVGYYSYVHPPQEQQQTPEATGSSTDSLPQIHHSIKFIVLDGYDIALMRRSPVSSKKRKQAVEILEQENGKNFGEGNENSPEGLEGLQRRFVAFNGALGPTQLEWLEGELESTRRDNENNPKSHQRVVILSHQPIHPDSANPVCLIWNYDAVLELLREYSDVVVASFAGHAHKGGYCLDEASGIHFRVVEAVLESKPPTKTFGVLNVYQDRLHLVGYGDCESAVYRFGCDETDDDDDGDDSTKGESCGDQ